MGNRATLTIIPNFKGAPAIEIYAHWAGVEGLTDALQTALSKRERWDDCTYLSRIIFCAVVADDINGTTGYGLRAVAQDQIDSDLIVDISNQEVSLNGNDTFSLTFDEFVKGS
jgi:hypothetical protein